MTLRLSDFDYELPREFIAEYPAEQRDLSRLLILDRCTGNIRHKSFKDFPDYIKPNDVLVLNNTKVINARLIGRRTSGGKAEIFLLDSLGNRQFKSLIRPSRRIKEGEWISFDNSQLKARLLEKTKGGNIIEFFSPERDIAKELNKLGKIPLPPYIKRKAEQLDDERYQTVYAKFEGATAAPTAGLHFTEGILQSVTSKGTNLAYVTLHVSYGTFAPVRSEDLVNHRMQSERFELNQESAMKINSAKTNSGKVFAVGTTACRVLETCALKTTVGSRQSTDYKVEARKGETDLFIYPSYSFKTVDALLTNFHLPKSTLLMLVSAFAGDGPRRRCASADKCAFAGRDLIFKAYREAMAKRYRFFSYGDCMLII